MAAKRVNIRVPRFEGYQGRSKRARENRTALAEGLGVDEETVVRWVTGEELPPDHVIEGFAEAFGFSVRWLMNWEDAPRSEIPERWRRHMAEDAIDRTNGIVPRECDGLLRSIEWRLASVLELDDPEWSSEVIRLQRLRGALLEFVAEPVEGMA
jgi:hypothetical protein